MTSDAVAGGAPFSRGTGAAVGMRLIREVAVVSSFNRDLVPEAKVGRLGGGSGGSLDAGGCPMSSKESKSQSSLANMLFGSGA